MAVLVQMQVEQALLDKAALAEAAVVAVAGMLVARMLAELLQVVKALTAARAQQVQTFLQAAVAVQPLWVVVQQVQQVKAEAAAQVHLLIRLGVLLLQLDKMFQELIGTQAAVVVVEIQSQ